MNIIRHNITGKHLFNLMCLVMFFVVSCRAKPIEEPVASHRDVTLSVNWKNISPYATAPSKARLWLYPEDNSAPIVLDLFTDKKITQKLALGNYRVIIRNDDLVTLKTRGHDKFDSHEAYLEVRPEISTNPAQNIYNNHTNFFSAKSSFQGTQELIDQADMLHMLMGATPKLITVTNQGDLDVTFYPQTVTSIYRINLTVVGDEPIIAGVVRLNNLATSVNFSTGKVSAISDVAMQFPLNAITENQFQTVATALGANPEISAVSPNTTKMQIVLQYADPNKEPLLQTVDMTEEFKDPTVNLDVNIKVDPSTSSPSINVDVKPWKDIVEEDIIVSPKKDK